MASIHKRTSDRTAEVSWQVKYRTPEGAARSRTFRLKRDADRFARDVETAKDGGLFVDPQLGKISMGEWVDRWLAAKTNITPSTRERYRQLVEVHLRPRWGSVALADVRHDGVQEWVSGLDLAPASVRKVYHVLSQALDYGVRAGRLSRNVAKGVSLPRVVVAEKRYLTHAQVEALAEAVGPSWRLLVLFLAYTGLRWGEVAALRVSRLNLLRRRVIIAESVTLVRGEMVFGAPKSHERREVPIPAFLVRDLEDHIAKKSPDSLVFLGPRGAMLRSRAFQTSVMIPAAESLGLCSPKLDDAGEPMFETDADGVRHPVFTRHLHPHELRHTAASLAIASGADVKVVQRMLGHKSAAMTLDLYGHLFPDRLDVVADALDRDRTAALTAPEVIPVFPNCSQAEAQA